MALHYIIPKITHAPLGKCWMEELDKLKQDITGLARKSTEDVYFHTLQDTGLMVHGDKRIIIECSDKFLEAIKKLPNCSGSNLFGPDEAGIETIRGAALRKAPKAVARVRSPLQRL